FTDPATTDLYTLSLHDALPICSLPSQRGRLTNTSAALITTSVIRTRSGATGSTRSTQRLTRCLSRARPCRDSPTRQSVMSKNTRSEEHTSELQSRGHLVCRLLL